MHSHHAFTAFCAAAYNAKIISSTAMSGEDVEAVIHRIGTYKGVLGCVIMTPDGRLLKSTCDAALSEQHASLIPPLTGLARTMIRDLDPQNELRSLRIRSRKHEIIVSPSEPGLPLEALQFNSSDRLFEL